MIKSIKALGANSAISPLAPFSINRRELCSDDVEIQILYCGICHSDCDGLSIRKSYSF